VGEVHPFGKQKKMRVKKILREKRSNAGRLKGRSTKFMEDTKEENGAFFLRKNKEGAVSGGRAIKRDKRGTLNSRTKQEKHGRKRPSEEGQAAPRRKNGT